MNASTPKHYSGLYLHTDFFTLVSANRDQIVSVNYRELIQPFRPSLLGANKDAIARYTDVILDLIKESKTEAENAGIVLTQDMVLVKRIQVPIGLDAGSVDDHLEWEVKQYCPSEAGKFTNVFYKLPFQSKEGNPYYISVLVRKEVTRFIKKLMDKTGLIIRDIDVDLFSHVRTVTTNYPSQGDQIQLLIVIYKKQIHYIFIKKNEYLFSSEMPAPVGVQELARLSAPELADIIFKKIKQLLFGHKISETLTDIEHIYILGGPQKKDMYELLSEQTSVPVQSAEPFHHIPVSDLVARVERQTLPVECLSAGLGAVLKNNPALTKSQIT